MNTISSMKRKVAVLVACLVVGLFPATAFGMVTGLTVGNVPITESGTWHVSDGGNNLEKLADGDQSSTGELYVELDESGEYSLKDHSALLHLNDAVDITLESGNLKFASWDIANCDIVVRNGNLTIEPCGELSFGTINASGIVNIASDGEYVSIATLDLSTSSHVVIDGDGWPVISITHFSGGSGLYRTSKDGTFTTDVPENFTDESYFEYISTGHIGDFAQNDDKSTHSKKCSCSLATVIETGDCSGGEATCTSGPVCTTCGIIYGAADASKHVWDFEVEGNVITATCENGCNTTATLTLTAPSNLTYDGNAKVVTVSGEIPGVTTPEISYTGDRTNVTADGFTASITVGEGNAAKTASVNYTIGKAPAPASSDITVSRNYAATKVSVPTGIVAGEGSSVTVGDTSESGTNKVSGAKLDGKGNLTFTLSGGTNGDTIVLPVSILSPNYEGDITATVTVTLTDKLDQRPLTVGATSTTVKPGEPLELSTSGGSGKGAVTYEVVLVTGLASVNGNTLTATGPGTVMVIATKEGTNQYNPARSEPIVITIE